MGVLVIRELLFRVYIRVPEFQKLPLGFGECNYLFLGGQ